MTRLVATLALTVTIAASASVAVDAQRGRGGGGSPRTMRPSEPSPSPSLNSPSFPVSGLNQLSFPLRGPLGVGTAVPSPFDARPGTFTRLHRIPPSLGIPFGYGYSGSFYDGEGTYEKMYRTLQPEITAGMLVLDVTPIDALVFVDTAYIGSVGDVQARGVALSAGRHFLDLEAPGYDKKTIELAITAGESLRYRYDMTPAQRAAVAPTPVGPRPPQTIYAISGCYAGNRPPVAANLPQGCDIRNVRIVRPQPPRAN